MGITDDGARAPSAVAQASRISPPFFVACMTSIDTSVTAIHTACEEKYHRYEAQLTGDG